MEIRNVTQFANFLKQHGLHTKDMAFQNIIFCAEQLGRMCNCWKQEQKQQLHNSCTAAYHNAVRETVPRWKAEFLSKTTDRQIKFFLDNGTLIGLVCQ